MPLRAETEVVAAPADLLAHVGPDGFAWLHDGVGIATAGVAARVAPEQVVDLLAGIEGDDPGWAGAGAIAVGSLPFVGPGELVVPVLTVGVLADGRAWRTVVTGGGEMPEAATPPPLPTPRHFEINPEIDHDEWAAMVEKALASIDEGRVAKVVLARAVTVVADRPFDRIAVLRHLRQAYPACFTFADAGFLGATPELLVRRDGDRVESRPFAGTAVAGAGDLSGSEKDAREHAFVVDQVRSILARYCDELAVQEAEIASVGNLTHFATRLAGRLRRPAPAVTDLVAALHPTPAVGGTPTPEAVRLIAELEPSSRRRYAGPVGWVDRRGDGEWGIALRCAEVDGASGRLLAGCGIVAGSEPEAEWAETQAKLEPMLGALVRP
jgi:menaquinone-specific isochorismate synthase